MPASPKSSAPRGRAFWVAGLVAVLVVAFVIVATTRGGKSDASSRVSATKSTLKAGQTTTTGVLDATGDVKRLDPKKSVGGVFGADEVPLDVSASDTRNLAAGDPVGIHVVAHEGSVVYGFEAFLCRAGETYQFDNDIRPSLTGKCAHTELSEGSDRYLEVRAAPPYEFADGVFRVGVGTDTYQTQDGRTATVTCDHDHPCVVVAKVQFPSGFGFELIPVTYR